ncbi:MAG: hypothetical protein JSV38_00625 [Desulfobacterales bacterium]|nr:MAG: hypothetical protein JSV38_00625 [Desulfobacterales bacterium]
MVHKPITLVVIFLFTSIFLASCITTKSSSIGVPGVRQVDRYDGDVHLGTSYIKRDDVTGNWFEAEKNSAGGWEYTEKGKKDKKRTLNRMLSGGER